MKIDFFRAFVILMTVGLVGGTITVIGMENRRAAAETQVPLPEFEEVTGPQVIFLVRHAEKADDDPRDPSLTEVGQARAVALADRLAARGIEWVLSTDYKRTRDTADPLASRLGLNVELYDPRDLPGAASAIIADGRTVLVVGHSNTTPQLVEALGGDPEGTIDDSEYDRLYELTVDGDRVTSQLHRFEAPQPVPTG